MHIIRLQKGKGGAIMRIVLCDDDIKVCEEYTRILREILAEASITSPTFVTYNSGVKLLENWQWSNSDILLLDIRMPDKDGMEVANELRDRGYRGEIIFLTVSKEHAIKAFNVDAYHYLVKGEVDKDKVASVFLEAYEDVTERERKYITLSRGGDLRNIAVDSIYYFETKNRIMTVHYEGDHGATKGVPYENTNVGEGLDPPAEETFAFYSTLDKLEELLKGQGFLRIHRAYLVAVEKSRKNDNNKEIHMSNGDILPLGAKYINSYEDIQSR